MANGNTQNVHRLTAVTWIMTGVALMFILLRLYCKRMLRTGFWWDDHLLIVAWVCLLIFASFSEAAISHGLGKHITDIDPTTYPLVFQPTFHAGFFSILAADLGKTSFAVTLLRLVPHTWQRITIWFIIISLNIIMGLCAIFLYTQCSPVARNWDQTVSGTCWPGAVQTVFAIIAGAYSSAMDFVLAFFPWVLLWKLQIRRPEKLGVAFAMSLGVLAGATGIVKTIYLQTMNEADYTFYGVDLMIWGTVESATTIMAACIPFFRILVKKASRYYQSSEDRNHQNSYRLEATRHNVVISSRQSKSKVGNQDDMSDRSILGSSKAVGIMETHEVEVEYHDRSDGETSHRQVLEP